MELSKEGEEILDFGEDDSPPPVVSDEDEGEIQDEEEEEGLIDDDDNNQDEILIRNKEKVNIDLEDGEVIEEGEVVEDFDEFGGRKDQAAKPICRFFSKGQCTWGSNCRFLHPGVTDKGLYKMFDSLPILQQVQQQDKPLKPGLLGYSPSEPAIIVTMESPWERGLRHAKEIIKQSVIRKETDIDFEEKKMNLTLATEEKENEEDYYISKKIDEPDPFERIVREQQDAEEADAINWSNEIDPNFVRDKIHHLRSGGGGGSSSRRKQREAPPRDDIDDTAAPPPRGDRGTRNFHSAEEWHDPWMRSSSSSAAKGKGPANSGQVVTKKEPVAGSNSSVSDSSSSDSDNNNDKGPEQRRKIAPPISSSVGSTGRLRQASPLHSHHHPPPHHQQQQQQQRPLHSRAPPKVRIAPPIADFDEDRPTRYAPPPEPDTSDTRYSSSSASRHLPPPPSSQQQHHRQQRNISNDRNKTTNTSNSRDSRGRNRIDRTRDRERSWSSSSSDSSSSSSSSSSSASTKSKSRSPTWRRRSASSSSSSLRSIRKVQEQRKRSYEEMMKGQEQEKKLRRSVTPPTTAAAASSNGNSNKTQVKLTLKTQNQTISKVNRLADPTDDVISIEDATEKNERFDEENISENSNSKDAAGSNTENETTGKVRREELLRQLKAVEDAIMKKKQKIHKSNQ